MGKNKYSWLIHEQKHTGRYEHFRLIYGLLHGFPDITADNQSGESGYRDLLDIAPECGPYNFNKVAFYNWFEVVEDPIHHNIDTIYHSEPFNNLDYPVQEWSSSNRLVYPENLCTLDTTKQGFFNGLDYMLLHNLYSLTYKIFKSEATTNYPNWLTDPDPQIGDWLNTGGSIRAATITCSNQITSDYDKNGNIVYGGFTAIAERNVKLSESFKVEAGAHFLGKIDNSNALDYRKTNYIPNCSNPSGNRVAKPDSASIATATKLLQSNNKPQAFYTKQTTKLATTSNATSQTESVVGNENSKIESSTVKRATVRPTTKAKTVEHSGFQIFPNPTEGLFWVALPQTVAKKQLIIANTLGTVVYTKTDIAENLFQIDLTTQAKGLYILRVVCEDQTWTKKVIIK